MDHSNSFTPSSVAGRFALLKTGDYPSSMVAWSAVAVFALAQIVSTVDRGMMALLVDPIRHDLKISDVQIALLQGLAFAIFYVAVGLPLGVVADTLNRRKVLIAGVMVWSAATFCCGLAQSFGQMFTARLLVGFGEAALAPCAVTMIGDFFPPNRRGPPMALYILGSMIAVGVGSTATGSLVSEASRGVFQDVPVLHGQAPWRIPFLIIGASGALIALLVFLLKEPVRQGALLRAREGLGVKQALAYLGQNWGVMLPFYGAVTGYGLGSSLAVTWGATLLMRGYGLGVGHVGKLLGGAQLAAALLGALCAALVIDPVVRRAGVGGKLLLAAAIAIMAVPSTIAWMAKDPGLAIAMTAEVMFVGALFGSTMLSTMTELVPADMKGLSVSLYAFVVTMIGGALGPLAVAWVNQALFHDPKLIGRSMTIVGVSALVLSAILAIVTRYAFQRAMRRDGPFARVLQANAS